MATPISNLKIGDRVRALSNLDEMGWITGPIVEIDKNHPTFAYAVNPENERGSRIWVYNNTVELLDRKFNPGDRVRLTKDDAVTAWPEIKAGAAGTVDKVGVHRDGKFVAIAFDDFCKGDYLYAEIDAVELIKEPTAMAQAMEQAERIDSPAADAAKDLPKFKAGDRVHCFGRTGTVDKGCPVLGGCIIVRLDGDGFDTHIDQADAELIDEEIKPEPAPEPAAEPAFKVGDKVVRSSFRNFGVDAGTIGEVVEVDGSWVTVKWESVSRGNITQGYGTGAEFCEEPWFTKREFQAGDKVRLSERGKEKYAHRDNNPHDQVGTITTTAKSWGFPIQVQWAERTNDYLNDELELVSEPAKPEPESERKPEPKFKVGDIVDHIELKHESDEYTKGEILEIVDGGERFKLRWPKSGLTFTDPAHLLELHKPEPAKPEPAKPEPVAEPEPKLVPAYTVSELLTIRVMHHSDDDLIRLDINGVEMDRGAAARVVLLLRDYVRYMESKVVIPDPKWA